MCPQNQTVSATSSSALAQVLAATQMEGNMSNIITNQQQQQQHNSQHHHHHHHHHHHNSPSLTCGIGSSLLSGGLGGSTMLSPPLPGNPFNAQSTYDWLTSSSSSLSSKHNSAVFEKRLNIENILQNCSNASKQLDTCNTDKSKNSSSSSCRFNQKVGQQNSDSYNLMAMFNLGINADTVLARSSSQNFTDASSLLQHQQQKQQHHQQQQQQQHSSHHHQQQQQQQQSSSSVCNSSAAVAAAAVAATTGSQLYNSQFSSTAAAAAAAVAAAATAATPYHLQQGHGLPSPTIYPPTPPPSAPWIHPWYPGDTF